MRNFLALALVSACATSQIPDDSLGSAIHVPTWFRTWDTSIADKTIDCAAQPIPHSEVSPLVRFRTGTVNTRTGVVIYLSTLADPPDQLLIALRCHRAWMLRAPHMDDCPLDLPNLTVEARGDDTHVAIWVTARDPRMVAEVQRRVERSVETHTEVARE